MKPRGWPGHSPEHSIVARGLPITGKSINKQMSSRVSIDKFKDLNHKNPFNEWIADVDHKGGGKIGIADVQQGDYDVSYLEFDGNDPNELIGYYHSHPEGLYAKPSVSDFSLAVKIQRLRTKANLKRTDGWVLMGLIADGKNMRYLFKPTRETEDKILRMDKKHYPADKEIQIINKLEKELLKSGELKVMESDL